jgi:hypothetical protein
MSNPDRPAILATMFQLQGIADVVDHKVIVRSMNDLPSTARYIIHDHGKNITSALTFDEAHAHLLQLCV